MTTIIKGQPTSEEVRQYLAGQNKPVILACSLGKDSLAAWCALEKDGIEVVPVYFWSVFVRTPSAYILSSETIISSLHVTSEGMCFFET